MSPPSAWSHRGHDGEYEDLLGLWADLESALAVLLSAPLQVQHFADKVRQLDRWLQDLMAHDTDAGLYLMFHSPAPPPSATAPRMPWCVARCATC